MIRFSHFILPKILCGLDRMTAINEAIEVASDIEHAQHEHGIDRNELVDFITKQNKGPDTVIKPWYSFGAKPLKEEDLYDKDLEKTHKELSDHYSKWSDSDKDIIRRYTRHPGDENTAEYKGIGSFTHKPDTQYAFRYINNRIMNNTPHEHDSIKMDRMDRALNVHGAPRDMSVWSGINAEHTNNVLYSEKVHHPSYLSTSLSAGTAMSFSHAMPKTVTNEEDRHILHIHVPQGHPGAYIEHVTAVPGEHEFILPRDTVLHIDHSQRQVHTKNYGWGNVNTYIHHAYPVKE